MYAIRSYYVTSSVFLPPGLMMIGAGFFGLAILVMLTLDRMAVQSEHSRLTATSTVTATGQSEREAIGGNFWDGMTA